MHAEPAIVTGGKHTMLFAALGLACMFGGIWLADAEVFGASGLDGATLIMRICSLVVYVVFFLIARWYARREETDLRWFFGVSSVIGMACFALGSAIVFACVPHSASSPAYQSAVLAGLFLTKVIGGPVSVSITCIFALLDRTAVMRSCALGMLGAFALYSLFTQFVGAEGSWGIVVAGGLLTCSLIFGMLGLGGPAGRLVRMRSASPRVPSALVVPGVVKRPVRKVITPGFVIVVIFSAMMLGFLRNGLAGDDPHANPVAFAMLVALVVVAALWKGLRTEHVFYAALLCTAVGVLLQPSLDVLLPGASDLAGGLGTALFEVVMWSLVVWAARNSTETLVAAAGARLIAVVGHLLGTVMVVGATLLMPEASAEEALRASELVMVLVYMILLVVLLKFPTLQVPFMSQVIPPSAPDAAPEPLEAPSAAEVDRRYWVEPCNAVADTYQLTLREREVLELLARGRDMPFMEEQLVVSRNTIKMHIRHIYTKLDVHSKQDIIDMVEQMRT
ncbi:helix-turn-helix transcriptional regulator [Eggerthella sp. YY7918]|uniref:helix-turn-helix transcriptional regulator n=1 Tax=Eggerthella sp. (strain YY7918) TaxID=502558 RepID=UPI0002DEAACD|nr:helix-turn-helix transcriptional regulator [Eggerthella sp. YY7918]